MKRTLIFPAVVACLACGCTEEPEPQLPPPVVIGGDMAMDMGGGSMIDMAPFMIPDVPDEPECDMAAEDLPDRFGFDTNCDGIDGDIAASIFVASYGDDSFEGTRFEPKRTIQAAVEQASMDPTKSWVLVQEGLYDGPLSLSDGVSIAGGYELGWSRDGDGFSTISGGNTVAIGTPVVRATNIISPTYLMNLEIRPDEQIAQGESVYTMVLLDSPGVILERMFVIGGAAGRGIDGAAGGPGERGGNGSKGGDGKEDSSGLCSDNSRPSAGSGGTNACGGNGGNGGRPGHGDKTPTSGDGGAGGTPSENGAAGGNPGSGGSKHNSGTAGTDGAAGAAGVPGSGATSEGYFDNFRWVSSAGETGGVGSYGAGGGGGGGGGGGTDGCDSWGGAGGGGGGGGCGGAGGLGGQPGGASVAIFLKGSAGAQIRNTRVVIGNGGNGGRGGNGGPGGDGGDGGRGGKRDHDDGLGGDGGDGGKGGQGGTGGGGAGGPAFGIYSDAMMLVPPSEMTFIPGQGGFGGAGSGPTGQGANGKTGDIEINADGGF